jgi:hypothetical protein
MDNAMRIDLIHDAKSKLAEAMELLEQASGEPVAEPSNEPVAWKIAWIEKRHDGALKHFAGTSLNFDSVKCDVKELEAHGHIVTVIPLFAREDS